MTTRPTLQPEIYFFYFLLNFYEYFKIKISLQSQVGEQTFAFRRIPSDAVI